MHSLTHNRLQHSHDYTDHTAGRNEKRTLQVIILTLITMTVEIIAGTLTGSMSLLADGWHMGTHAFALGITFISYIMSRRLAESPRFAFGTGKFGILAGYTSAIFLGSTALLMIYESIERLLNPVQIAFTEALSIAVSGLLINALSVWLLRDTPAATSHHQHHTHSATTPCPHTPSSAASKTTAHTHTDHNIRAAYLHVLADTLTSILAILALLTGKYLGYSFLDPVIGIIGGLVIAKWAYGLLRSTGLLLLDGTTDQDIRAEITQAIESDADSTISDLHIWPLDSTALGAVITVISGSNREVTEYTKRLRGIERLKHITIELHRCQEPNCSCRLS